MGLSSASLTISTTGSLRTYVANPFASALASALKTGRPQVIRTSAAASASAFTTVRISQFRPIVVAEKPTHGHRYSDDQDHVRTASTNGPTLIPSAGFCPPPYHFFVTVAVLIGLASNLVRGP